MVSKTVVVLNESGFHVRPASVLAKAAEACSSTIEIKYKNNIINAKSILNIVSAAITKGSEILICCSGPNEEADLEKILDVMTHLE